MALDGRGLAGRLEGKIPDRIRIGVGAMDARVILLSLPLRQSLLFLVLLHGICSVITQFLRRVIVVYA